MIRINGKVMKRSDFRKQCSRARAASPSPRQYSSDNFNSILSDRISTNGSEMDLLASILNEMDAPPSANEEQRKIMKRQKEAVERYKKKEKEELLRYRRYVEDRLARFALDERPYIEFQSTDKIHRTIVYEVAENAGFLTMSFAAPSMEKYAVVYKKECSPSEDELTARRNGDVWNMDIAKEYADKRHMERIREIMLHQEQIIGNDRESSKSEIKVTKEEGEKINHPEMLPFRSASSTKLSNRQTKIAQEDQKCANMPTFNYQKKYAHLIGNDTSPCAVSKTDANRSYGFVPSQNKMDVRSIEQTMNELRAKKRQRLEQIYEEGNYVESDSEAAHVARLLRSKNKKNSDSPRHGSIMSALLESSSSKTSIGSKTTDCSITNDNPQKVQKHTAYNHRSD